MSDRYRFRALQTLDAVAFGVGLLAGALVLGTAVAAALGGGTTRVLETVFVVGAALLAVGTLLTRPKPAAKRRREASQEGGDDEDADPPEPTEFQRVLARPFPDQEPLMPSDRFSLGGRLLAAGIVHLLVVFSVEYLLT